MVLIIIFLLAFTLILSCHFYQTKQLINVYSNLEKDISQKIKTAKVTNVQIKIDSYYIDKINQKLDTIKKQIAVLEIVSNQ